MYDMLERNMDQPLTELSKIKMFKRLRDLNSKFLEIYSEGSLVKIKYQPVICRVLRKLDFGQNMDQNRAMADDLLADAEYLLLNNR